MKRNTKPCTSKQICR